MTTDGDKAERLSVFRRNVTARVVRLVELADGAAPVLAARASEVQRLLSEIGLEARRHPFDGLERVADAAAEAVASWARGGKVPDRAPAALSLLAALALAGTNEHPDRWKEWSEARRAELVPLLEALALDVPSSERTVVSTTSQQAVRASSAAASAPQDVDLADLFRAEIEEGVPRLQELFLALEDDGTSAPAVEEAMRIAHSLKGAARIVGFGAIVTVLHAAEDLLSASTSGRPVARAEAETLLRLVDVLEALSRVPGVDVPAWLVKHQPRLTEIADALRRPALTAAATSSATPGAKAAAGTGVANAGPRGLRVSADGLSRLLGLAGETVVEARRLSAWPRSSVALERAHVRLRARAEEIQRRARALGDVGLATAVDGLVSDLGDASRLFHETRHATSDGLQRLLDAGERLYLESLRARQRPFAQLVPALRRQVRDSAKALGKNARLEVHGASTPVDGDVLTALEPMLTHLVTNALDHGVEIESTRLSRQKSPHGTLRVELRHLRGQLSLTLADDGAGIDPERVRAKVIEGKLVDELTARALGNAELYEFLFLPAFSTAREVSVHSGRGVGLDAVRTEVTRMGGRIAIHSELGTGTRFELTLPLTRVVVRALLVLVGNEPYALPLARAGRVVRVPLSELYSSEGRDYVELDGENVGVVRADDLLDVGPPAPTVGDMTLVLLGEEGTRYGLVVDRALGEDDLVVRPLDPRLGRVPDVAATALLADGSPTIVLDGDDLLRSIEKLSQTRRPAILRTVTSPGSAVSVATGKRVLVVDDSVTVREVERQMLQRKGYEVDVAVDGVEAWAMLKSRRYDLVVTDVDMPRMTGLELVRSVRADPQLERLPIVMVSYKERDDDRLRGLEVGADQYLAKSSFHDDQLTNAVRDLIGEAG